MPGGVVRPEPRERDDFASGVLGGLESPDDVFGFSRAADGEEQVAIFGPKVDGLLEYRPVALIVGKSGQQGLLGEYHGLHTGRLA